MAKDKTRRQYGSGSVSPRHDHPECPAPVKVTGEDGKVRKERPDHKCKGTWVARLEAGWTPRGTRRRIARVAPTEAAAKRLLRDMQREDADGTEIGGRRITVKAWCETWLGQQATRVRPKTYETDSSMVRRWIVPTIGHRKLADLTPADVRRLTTAVRDAGRTSTTARYAQAVLNRALKAAIREGHPVPERVLLVDKPAAAVSDREALTPPQAVSVLGAAGRREDSARWVAALLYGMRQGECLGLTWEHVDLERGELDVSWQLQTLRYADREHERFQVPDGYEARRLEGAWHLTRPKTAKGQRIVPLLPLMAGPLAAWREVAPESPYGLVWPRPDGRPRDSKADRAEWWALCEEAGVVHPGGRRYHLHEARNTAATLLMLAGVDPLLITEILGHSSIVVSRGYMTVDRGQLRDALTRVTGLLTPPPA